MNLFERSLQTIFRGMTVYENDVAFGYETFYLPGQDNARIFRMPRMRGKASLNPKPPIRGLFVLLTIHDKLKRPSLTFCSFPKGSDGSTFIRHGAIAYGPEEMAAARKHIADFLTLGKVPQADEELAETLGDKNRHE